MPRLVVVSGRSGSGKTSALNILEDVGFDCIDNLPPSLLPDLIKQLNSERINDDLRLAVGIDARNLVGDLNKLPDILAGLEASGIEVSVIFLQARRSDLIRRYSEIRRKHPLSNETVSLPEAIDLEAKILSPILNISDRNIDTSGLSLHQLRDLVKNTSYLTVQSTWRYCLNPLASKKAYQTPLILFSMSAAYRIPIGNKNCVA